MVIDHNLTLNECMINGGSILNYQYIQCVVITKFCSPHPSDHNKFILSKVDLLVFRKKLPVRCECDFMNMLVNACVSLEGRFFSFH